MLPDVGKYHGLSKHWSGSCRVCRTCSAAPVILTIPIASIRKLSREVNLVQVCVDEVEYNNPPLCQGPLVHHSGYEGVQGTGDFSH